VLGSTGSCGPAYLDLLPGIFFVLVTGFLAIQVKAARIHTSVELSLFLATVAVVLAVVGIARSRRD
jgi:hypothetical protein